MRLLSKIIIKDVSDNTCFVLDLEDESDQYFKCEDVFAELIQHVYKLDSFNSSHLVEFLKGKYPDVKESDLQRDAGSFIQFLEEKKFLDL